MVLSVRGQECVSARVSNVLSDARHYELMVYMLDELVEHLDENPDSVCTAYDIDEIDDDLKRIRLHWADMLCNQEEQLTVLKECVPGDIYLLVKPFLFHISEVEFRRHFPRPARLSKRIRRQLGLF